MKKMILISVSLWPLTVLAQKKALSNIENYAVGDKSTYLTTSDFDSTVVLKELKKTGSDVVWDFTNIGNVSDTLIQTIVKPESTEFKDDFLNANIVEQNSDGSMVFTEDKKDKNFVWGFVNAKMKIVYSDPMLFLKRPFEYKETVSDTFKRNYQINGMLYKGEGSSSVTADGWGKLILPNGNFANVIRLKFLQISRDSTQNNKMEIKTITYAWFLPNYKKSLLKIDLNIVSSQYYNSSTMDIHYLYKINGKSITADK